MAGATDSDAVCAKGSRRSCRRERKTAQHNSPTDSALGRLDFADNNRSCLTNVGEI